MSVSESSKDQFLRVYDENSDAIFRFCFFKTFEQEKAEEITQEAFVRAWEYLESGKEVANLRAFIYRVAKNIIVDYFRKHKESSLDALREKGFDASHFDHVRWGDIIDGKRMVTVVEQLDEKYREVILLRYVDDLPIREIAHIIGESENHVSVRIHRGLKKLREMTKEEV